MTFISGDVKITEAVQIVPNATLYDLGVLTNSIHMNWLKTVGGRLKSDYRYSKDVVYNNFIWIEASERQKVAIEEIVKEILDIRSQYPAATLAELYDEVTMPYELRNAHCKNDRTVVKAYGFENILNDKSAIVVVLLELYSNHS